VGIVAGNLASNSGTSVVPAVRVNAGQNHPPLQESQICREPFGIHVCLTTQTARSSIGQDTGLSSRGERFNSATG
jgi:hypothetical protein